MSNAQAVTDADFEEKVEKGSGLTVVDFWATWCGPCVAEMPNVKNVYSKFHPQGFEIVGISLDQSRDRLDQYVKSNQIAWPQYFDGKWWNNVLPALENEVAVPLKVAPYVEMYRKQFGG